MQAPPRASRPCLRPVYAAFPALPPWLWAPPEARAERLTEGHTPLKPCATPRRRRQVRCGPPGPPAPHQRSIPKRWLQHLVLHKLSSLPEPPIPAAPTPRAGCSNSSLRCAHPFGALSACNAPRSGLAFSPPALSLPQGRRPQDKKSQERRERHRLPERKGWSDSVVWPYRMSPAAMNTGSLLSWLVMLSTENWEMLSQLLVCTSGSWGQRGWPVKSAKHRSHVFHPPQATW